MPTAASGASPVGSFQSTGSSFPNSPIEEQPDTEAENSSTRKTILVLLIVILCAGGGIGFKFWKKKQAAELAQKIKSATRPVASEPKTLAKATPVISSVASTSTPPPSVAGKTPAPASVSVAAAAMVKFPSLRLQSIFYRPSSPSVMINGKTLYIADEIQGVKVAAISPASVTLVLSGQTNVLTLR